MAYVRAYIEINDYLDEADTKYLVEELERRKVDVLDFISKLNDDELIKFICSQKKLSIIQAEKLKQIFKNL